MLRQMATQEVMRQQATAAMQRMTQLALCHSKIPSMKQTWTSWTASRWKVCLGSCEGEGEAGALSIVSDDALRCINIPDEMCCKGRLHVACSDQVSMADWICST